MVYAGYSFKNVFQYEANDVYWCTADIGWITGHTYIVYGPLLSGATTVMFEGCLPILTLVGFGKSVTNIRLIFSTQLRQQFGRSKRVGRNL